MFTPENLISDEYRALNAQMHMEKHYGVSGYQWNDKIEQLRGEFNLRTVLDYGCGQGSLGESLGHPDWLREYDPAIEGKNRPPATVSDLVVCTDVLEHIEPDRLDTVLKHINSLSRNMVFLSICTVPAEKHLADGRNAHLSLHDAAWWRNKLDEVKFLIADFKEVPGGVQVLCS
jgi:2-polyprenyl-3-methyl-5-hydroxy-6-metoxy-1,4-benzoquinol methylase